MIRLGVSQCVLTGIRSSWSNFVSRVQRAATYPKLTKSYNILDITRKNQLYKHIDHS